MKKIKTYQILDIKGLVLKAMHSSKDPDAVTITKQNKKGEDVTEEMATAEHGFANFVTIFLEPILQTTAPRNILAIWDGGNNYRQAIYPGYKEKRKNESALKCEKEVARDKAMFNLVKSFLASIGCTQAKVAGVEADDLIAELCTKLSGNKIVSTVDADLVVLSNDTTTVITNDGACGAEFRGVPTYLMTLYKSLVGDTSDEYPGIKGFGAAKWDALVEEFGLDGMEELEGCVINDDYSLVDEVLEDAPKNSKGKFVGAAFIGLGLIQEQKNGWPLQYDLAKLHPELCSGVLRKKIINIQWYKRIPSRENTRKVLEVAGALDMMPIVEKFLPVFTLVTNENWDDFTDHFIARCGETELFPFDYESYDAISHQPFQEAGKNFVDVLSQSITGMSISYGDNLQYTAYISTDHADTDNVFDMNLVDVLETAMENGELIAHNAPFEHALTETNLEFDLPPIYDTAVMSSYVNENERAGLKGNTKQWLNYTQAEYKALLTAVEESRPNDREALGRPFTMQDLTGKEVLDYGCDDALCTGALFDLFKIIMDIEGSWDIVKENAFVASNTLYKGFEAGINVDFNRLKELEKIDRVVIDENTAKVRALLLENCYKPDPDTSDILYNELKDFTEASMKEAGKNKGAVETGLIKLRERIEANSYYTPLTIETEYPVFKPTPIQFNKVLSEIGFTGEGLTGVTVNKVNAWAAGLAGVETSGEFKTFYGLLMDSLPEIKAREGDNYDRLSKFCSTALATEAKVTTSGTELNFNSPQQMQYLLYLLLKLPIRLRAKVQLGSTRDRLGFEGGPATDSKAVGTALAEDTEPGDWRHQVMTSMVLITKADTRFKYYYTPYPLWEHPSDGMIHGGIKNCGTVTRRPSASSPNLLQISKGDIRSCILPFKKDHVIISPDFAGQELRIMASESRDPVLLDAYLGKIKKDIHGVTASGLVRPVMDRLYKDEIELIEWENGELSYDSFQSMRKGSDPVLAKIMNFVRDKFAKAVNFLIIYGGGPTTLARNVGIPLDMAKIFMDMVFGKYKGIKSWQEAVIAFAVKHGYVETAYGTRRHATEDLFSRDNGRRNRMERQLINATIQGCAAEILKLVLREIHISKLMEETGAVLIAPVYDEVAASVPITSAVEYSRRLIDIMNVTPPGHAVPMVAELSIGVDSWDNMVELGANPTDDDILAVLDTKRAA